MAAMVERLRSISTKTIHTSFLQQNGTFEVAGEVPLVNTVDLGKAASADEEEEASHGIPKIS